MVDLLPMSLRPGWKTQSDMGVRNKNSGVLSTETRQVRDLVDWMMEELRSKQGPGIPAQEKETEGRRGVP